MNIPEKFNEIRPYEPEELQEVFKRLMENSQFCQVMGYVFPGMPLRQIEAGMKQCRTNLDFQKMFCHPFLIRLMEKASAGIDMDATAIAKEGRYTFVSNHRDIVLDSALLDKQLIELGFDTTCEIAIGDNLLSLPWVKDLVRVNKSFIVRRGLSPRETLTASKTMSEYMHFVIAQKHDNIWIAQREGRAKDSDDRTQPAILKMMAMGGGGSVPQRLAALHIVPLAISYEYDPCDYLKAREMQLKRDVEGWKKSAHDDVVSMQTGIMGYKGRVHYHCAPCIDSYLLSLSPDIPKTEIFNVIAAHIDREIHRNYRLYPGNYVAYDIQTQQQRFAGRYTEQEKLDFLNYLCSQAEKVDLPDRDAGFIFKCMIDMYANPVANYLAANE